ncbi:hypothetical protein HPP92_026938 [Vanilla planifolia]|uniref:Protein SDA1 n=1 Tax=Vanilla planifolia TaxID=51239 RepID=A0A835U8S5_VANPL|nr:hypothetical protein HPP92_026938 [Vanilla planifolia]
MGSLPSSSAAAASLANSFVAVTSAASSRYNLGMKLDPEGYEAELLLIYRHFESSLHFFLQSEVRTLPSSFHSNLAQAIILVNTKGEEELRARVMVSALSFLLGYEHVVDDDDDSEAASDEDDEYGAGLQVAPLESDNTVCLSASIQFGAGGKELLHEKAVSIVARSLITLFREICPSFLVKKDQGHPIDSRARPKAFGEVSVTNECLVLNDAYRNDSDEEGSDDGELANVCDTEELNEELEVQATPIDGQDEDADDGKDPSNRKKRKLGDFVECLNAFDASPCSHKRLAIIKAAKVSTDEADGILSNEDFQHIKEPKAHVRSKLSKQERVVLIRAGRGDTEKYKAKIVVKQKTVEATVEGDVAGCQKSKTSSFSSRKKEASQGGKQFRGRKALK